MATFNQAPLDHQCFADLRLSGWCSSKTGIQLVVEPHMTMVQEPFFLPHHFAVDQRFVRNFEECRRFHFRPAKPCLQQAIDVKSVQRYLRLFFLLLLGWDGFAALQFAPPICWAQLIWGCLHLLTRWFPPLFVFFWLQPWEDSYLCLCPLQKHKLCQFCCMMHDNLQLTAVELAYAS